MENQFSRTEKLIGIDGIEKLKNSKIAIFGIGGVGSFVAEGLARAGVLNFILIDNDKIDITNLNRQIHATLNTIDQYKVDVMKQRILSINPKANIKVLKIFFTSESEPELLNESIDYIVDCIDTIKSKIELVLRAKNLRIPIISSMGTGNKLDPKKLKISDIYKTEVCPLAKVMRKELRKKEIKELKVIFSTEEPIKIKNQEDDLKKVEQSPGSISFVPSVAGLIIASEVVRDILKIN